MSDLPIVKLKIKKAMPVIAGHPWIFSNAIESVSHGAENGKMVQVFSNENKFLGVGFFNSNTSIRVRIISRNENIKIDKDFFVENFLKLEKLKKEFLPKQTTGYRLSNADADYLPGLIIDRYDDVFVFQIHTLGMDAYRVEIIEALKSAFSPSAVVERSDIEARKFEGLNPVSPEVHFGKIVSPIQFEESGIKFFVDVLNGQKTGFFLDQRDSRRECGKLSNGKKVLNLFSYTGSFGLYSAVNGAARVTTIDSSKDALELAEKNFRANKIKFDGDDFVCADVFEYLLSGEVKCGEYDLIICDPPAFAKSNDRVEQAKKAYLDVNKMCLSLLNIGGILITSSCSGRVTHEDFKNVLKIASGQTKRDVRVLCELSQPFDHTERICFPEGKYLKTLVLQVI